MDNNFPNKAALRAGEAGVWQRLVTGLVAPTLVMFAVEFLWPWEQSPF